MAPDVLIRRCTLTVRGRDGWGWGTDPHRYLDPALSAVERAVARVLRDAALDPELDVRIVEPVRLAFRRDGTLVDQVRAAFLEQVRRAAEQAQAARPPRDEPSPIGVPAEPAELLLPTAATTAGTPALARLLSGWSRSGRLPQIVASWPAVVVGRWVATLAAAGDDAEAVELAEPAVAAIADVVLPAGSSSPALSGPAALLVLIGALTAAAQDRPLGQATLGLATRHAARRRPTPAPPPLRPPDEGSPPAAPPTDPAAPSDDGLAPDRPPTRPRPPGYPDRLAVPGLPFLVLIQLGRIGYLDGVVAAAAAGGVPQLVRLVAAGLTGKALPPPGRGWRRDPTEAQAVAIAAGLPIGAPDELAHARRDELTALLAPLESVLIALYAAGRTTGDEVVLSATPHGLVCGETAGALPIAWRPDGADPGAVLDQLGRPPHRSDDLFMPLAAELAPRRAYPNLGLTAVEHHLGAAVGTALGSLAQELWGTAAPNAPLQAVHRLADLEVQLRTGRAGLAIAVPRGQRSLDLGRVGLLDRWVIPWSPAGCWELVTW